jgi:hypothetical protein
LIVSLARKRIDVERRQRCPGLVREFLRWQRMRRDQQQPCGLDDYLMNLQARGASSELSDQVKDAASLLQRYLKEIN